MKNLDKQSINKVNIVGKLLETTFREGTTKDGKPYESCNYIVRVKQTIEGKEEIHEIPASVFGTKFTNSGKLNPAYKTVQDMKNFKTIQRDGEEMASVIRTNSGSINENYFVSQSGQLVDSWQIRTSFVNEGGKGELATFNLEIFIIDMHDEENSQGETTGRLVIRGGVVQYGEKLDVLDFFVEAPDKIEYISRNWNINDTVLAKGYIRYTPKEDVGPVSQNTWGDDIPEVAAPQMARELIIAGGSDEPYDEDFAYDEKEIRKGYNVRKAAIEQAQFDAKNKSTTKKNASTTSKQKFEWEY